MLRPTEYTSYSLRFDGSEITPDETEFLLAMLAYQKRFRRRYPTWREVLHVAHCLGYRKVAPMRSLIARARPTAAEWNQQPIDPGRTAMLADALPESPAAGASEVAAAANRRRVRPAVSRRGLVARRPGRAAPQLPLVGVRRGQRHRAGSRRGSGRSSTATPARPSTSRCRCRTRTRSAGCSTGPNPWLTPWELWYLTVVYLELTGNCVLVRRAAVGRRDAARHAGRSLDHPDAVGAHRPGRDAST